MGGQAGHGGIAMEAVVDFNVQCSYLATYESNSLEMEAEHAALADKVDKDAGDMLKVKVEFLTKLARNGNSRTKGGFNPIGGTAGGPLAVNTITDGEGNTFGPAPRQTTTFKLARLLMLEFTWKNQTIKS